MKTSENPYGKKPKDEGRKQGGRKDGKQFVKKNEEQQLDEALKKLQARFKK